MIDPTKLVRSAFLALALLFLAPLTGVGGSLLGVEAAQAKNAPLVASVLFEAPHRIARTLRDLGELAPERPAALCRELTKLHEEVVRKSLAELAELAEAGAFRGEITLVVAGAPEAELAEAVDESAIDESILSGLRAGESPRSVVEALAADCHLPRRELYRRVTELARQISSQSREE